MPFFFLVYNILCIIFSFYIMKISLVNTAQTTNRITGTTHSYTWKVEKKGFRLKKESIRDWNRISKSESWWKWQKTVIHVITKHKTKERILFPLNDHNQGLVYVQCLNILWSQPRFNEPLSKTECLNKQI